MTNTETTTTERITVAEACIRLELPWHTVYTWLLAGKFGTPRKEGRVWMIPAAGVDAHISRQRAGSSDS